MVTLHGCLPTMTTAKFSMTDEQFDAYITQAMDELPQEYMRGLQNVAIVMADAPTAEQRVQLAMRPGSLLLGLFEGIPLTARGTSPVVALPDKITLFKDQIAELVHDEATAREQIKRTLWHEIAHYYGLEHSHIDALQAPHDHS